MSSSAPERGTARRRQATDVHDPQPAPTPDGGDTAPIPVVAACAAVPRRALLVEFTGVTGAGKSTLAAAVHDLLARKGYVVQEAHEAILRSYGLRFAAGPTVCSFLVHTLSVWPFLRYALSREGFRLARLALRLILRDADSPRIAVALLRNFVKRVAVHQLLRQRCQRRAEADFLLCDEGILHAAHNLFVHTGTPPQPDEILAFGELVPRPDLAVRVMAPPLQIIECTLRRGHGRVANNPRAVEQFVAHARLTFDILCSVPAIKGRLLVIDNPIPEQGAIGVALQDRAHAIVRFLTEARVLKGMRDEG